MIGKKINMLTIIDEYKKRNKKYYLCKCDCGNDKSIRSDSVTTGKTKSCGCLAIDKAKKQGLNNSKNITGQRYGRLVALFVSHKKNYRTYWMCKCDCGNEKAVAISQLTSGKTKSCGCLNRELSSERMKGENHPMYGIRGEKHHKWNSNLTDKERHDKRDTVENYHFRNRVFERDNYTCQCCGSRSSKNDPVKINAHHINNYYSDIDNRYNIDNGITLCEKCHKKFHKEYGNKNNSKKQINKFIKDNTEVN